MRKYSTGLEELDELWGGYQSTLMERLSDGIAALRHVGGYDSSCEG